MQHTSVFIVAVKAGSQYGLNPYKMLYANLVRQVYIRVFDLHKGMLFVVRYSVVAKKDFGLYKIKRLQLYLNTYLQFSPNVGPAPLPKYNKVVHVHFF